MFRRMRKPTGKTLRMNQTMEARSNEKLSRFKEQRLNSMLKSNVETMEGLFGESNDFVLRRFLIGGEGGVEAAAAFIDGLVDSKLIDEFILKAAMTEPSEIMKQCAEAPEQVNTYVKLSVLPVNEISETDHLYKVVEGVLSGDSVVFLEGSSQAIVLNTKGWERRGVEEPRTESVVRGPRNGFTETLRINTAQIRLKLKDPELRVKGMTVGQRSKTNVAVMYIEGLTNHAIADEIIRRIEAINIDAVIDSGYIEQLIEDTHWTPFPMIQNTERPDKVAANLLEGKVAIVCDGSPFVLIAPAVFSQFYHSPEDYYERFLISTFIRIIRVISMGMAIMLPSLYIAFSSFHPEMIPSRLVIAMAAGRSTVPFPSIVEAFLMEVTMEILREASVRLPGPIGPTIGIVGALVVGQAAVEAGIVSPIMVIIVALTTIGSFASPSYSAAIALRMLRFPMMIAASLFGLYGIMLLLILIIIHLCSLKSFGVPYMSPVSPYHRNDIKDTFFRVPIYKLKKRPTTFMPKDKYRMAPEKKGGNTDGANQ